MTKQVDDTDLSWPPDQWHPAYESIREWLDNEAPVASPLVVNHLTKDKNRPRFRIIKRRA